MITKEKVNEKILLIKNTNKFLYVTNYYYSYMSVLLCEYFF